MRLLENVFYSAPDYGYFERFTEDDGKTSRFEKIDADYEYFVPSNEGVFKDIHGTQRYERCLGNSKQSAKYSRFTPIYRHLRDNLTLNKTPRIWYLDIETRVGQNSEGFPLPEKALEEVCLIQIYDVHAKKVIIIGFKEFTHQDKYSFETEVQYLLVKDERQLFELFFQVLVKLNPLIVYAWNGAGFDFPYLYFRAKRLGFSVNRFSPFLSQHSRASTDIFKDEYVKLEKKHGFLNTYSFHVQGMFWLDLKEVYQKFSQTPLPSYSLDFVAKKELNKQKVTHSEYQKFDDFYQGNYCVPLEPTDEQCNSEIYQCAIRGDYERVKTLGHSDFIYYGIIDTLLLKEIDEKTNLTVLMLEIAEKMGCLISDTLGTVKIWSQYIANTLWKENICLPFYVPNEDETPNITGGYVRDVLVGKHEDIISADVNSMYPLLSIVSFNISPETFVDYTKLDTKLGEIQRALYPFTNSQDETQLLNLNEEKFQKITEIAKSEDLCFTVGGGLYTKKKQGILPKLVLDIYLERKAKKKKSFEFEKQGILIKEILEERRQCK